MPTAVFTRQETELGRLTVHGSSAREVTAEMGWLPFGFAPFSVPPAGP